MGSVSKGCVRWLLLVQLLAAGSVRAEPLRQEVSLAASNFTWYSFLRHSRTFLTLEVAYHRPVREDGPWNLLRVGGGLRTNPFARDFYVPVEGFLQAQLTARAGIWEAVVGPELGVSGFDRLIPKVEVPANELKVKEDRLLGPVYLAFSAAPARVRLGRFSVSLMELSVGTGFPGAGQVLRVQVNFISLGSML